uniref:Uncharacterized protein n=1 Tax=Arundo donax TaxID=35708 RepID=A0A0A8XS43_ARUDO
MHVNASCLAKLRLIRCLVSFSENFTVHEPTVRKPQKFLLPRMVYRLANTLVSIFWVHILDLFCHKNKYGTNKFSYA